MFKIPVINCTNEFDIPVLILSTSFVTLLIISPVELLSKKVIGRFLNFKNKLLLISLTILWDNLAVHMPLDSLTENSIL